MQTITITIIKQSTVALHFNGLFSGWNYEIHCLHASIAYLCLWKFFWWWDYKFVSHLIIQLSLKKKPFKIELRLWKSRTCLQMVGCRSSRERVFSLLTRWDACWRKTLKCTMLIRSFFSLLLEYYCIIPVCMKRFDWFVLHSLSMQDCLMSDCIKFPCQTSTISLDYSMQIQFCCFCK